MGDKTAGTVFNNALGAGIFLIKDGGERKRRYFIRLINTGNGEPAGSGTGC
jgi:hypothetical protein